MELKPQQQTKFNLSIASIFKNESHILPEWLTYYHKMGVEHFYLVNNNSTDNYQSAIKPYLNNITLFHETKHACQLEAYNEIILPIAKQTTKWLLVVDLDEFVYNPKGINFTKLLHNYNQIAAVSAPWIFFGSNQQIKQPKSVIEGFTSRMYYGTGESVNVKNFYQTKYLQRLYPHHAEFTEPHLCTVSSKSHTRLVNGQDTVYENDLKNDRFVFLTNHYAIQSKEFFFNIKTKRGDVHNPKNDNLRNEAYFRQYDHNQIIDLKLYDILNNQKIGGPSLLLSTNKKQIKHIIIGFPSPDKDKIIKHLNNHFDTNLTETKNIYRIESVYYDEFLIYSANLILSQIASNFSHAQIWVLTDTTRRILYSHYKTEKPHKEDFKTIYQNELKAIENETLSIESTTLIKFGNTDHYIKNANKFFSKLKVCSTQEFINFEISKI